MVGVDVKGDLEPAGSSHRRPGQRRRRISTPDILPPARSPFLSVYQSEDGSGLSDQAAEEQMAFLNELYDEEFDEAAFELVREAAALHESRFVNEWADPRATGHQAERALEQHFAPLIRETEAMIGSLATQFANRDSTSLTQPEIESLIDQYHPAIELSPSFENFPGRVRKAVKKVVKKGVDLAKKGASAAAKLGLGPILDRLKALIKPLLKRVVQTAIGKLPPKLQPIARTLAMPGSVSE